MVESTPVWTGFADESTSRPSTTGQLTSSGSGAITIPCGVYSFVSHCLSFHGCIILTCSPRGLPNELLHSVSANQEPLRPSLHHPLPLWPPSVFQGALHLCGNRDLNHFHASSGGYLNTYTKDVLPNPPPPSSSSLLPPSSSTLFDYSFF